MEEDKFKKLEKLENKIKSIPYETLNNNVYICIANSCTLLTSFYRKKGARGWSAELVDDTGNPMLSQEEQQILESMFEKAPWMWEMMASLKGELSKEGSKDVDQVGGGIPSLGDKGQFIKPKIPFPALSGDDISMDRLFEKFLKKTEELDKFWSDFARGSPGYAKLIEQDLKIYGPGGVEVKVSTKPLLILLVGILDAFRLSYARGGEESTLLTLTVFIEEVITGQWRQALLTSAGFLSPSGMAIGIIFKYIVNAWMLINPTLRDDILRDFYKGTKSLVIGFFLWLASILPPQAIKAPIEATLEALREKAKGIQEYVKEIEDSGSTALSVQGKKLDFSQLNIDILTKLSLDDIQNFQSLAQWELIVCSHEFEQIMEQIKQEPILRFVMELLGVPTTDEEQIRLCKRKGPYPPMKEVVKSMTEVDIPHVSLAEKTDQLKQKLSDLTKGGSRRLKKHGAGKASRRQTQKKEKIPFWLE